MLCDYLIVRKIFYVSNEHNENFLYLSLLVQWEASFNLMMASMGTIEGTVRISKRQMSVTYLYEKKKV